MSPNLAVHGWCVGDVCGAIPGSPRPRLSVLGGLTRACLSQSSHPAHHSSQPHTCHAPSTHTEQIGNRPRTALRAMASRRATVTLARASAPLTKAAVATPARLRAAVHLSSRQHHTQPTGQRLRPSVSALCAGRASSPIVSTSSRRLTPAAARAYSADAEGKPHKIWDFEAVCSAHHPIET